MLEFLEKHLKDLETEIQELYLERKNASIETEGSYDILIKKRYKEVEKVKKDIADIKKDAIPSNPAEPKITGTTETRVFTPVEKEKPKERLPFEPEMIFVEGGKFHMGQPDPDIGGKGYSKDEQPVHEVNVSSFYIGKFQVTQAQWKAIMIDNPSHFKGDNLPVETVSWDDVQIFLKKLNKKTGKEYRLPTEAEWEYAARGGEESNNYTYSGSNNIDVVAWYEKNSGNKTHDVGTQKQHNELGIYDMSGNVWEWCNDWYDENYYKNSPSQNPQGVASGSNRVNRGGSWLGNARGCRVTGRNGYTPTGRNGSLGFRVAFSSLQ